MVVVPVRHDQSTGRAVQRPRPQGRHQSPEEVPGCISAQLRVRGSCGRQGARDPREDRNGARIGDPAVCLVHHAGRPQVEGTVPVEIPKGDPAAEPVPPVVSKGTPIGLGCLSPATQRRRCVDVLSPQKQVDGSRSFPLVCYGFVGAVPGSSQEEVVVAVGVDVTQRQLTP